MTKVKERFTFVEREAPFFRLHPGSLECVLEYHLPIERRSEYVDWYLSLERSVGSERIVSCTFARAQKLFQGLYDNGYIRESKESESIPLARLLEIVQELTKPWGRDMETYRNLEATIASVEHRFKTKILIQAEQWIPFVELRTLDQVQPPDRSSQSAIRKPPPPHRSSTPSHSDE